MKPVRAVAAVVAIVDVFFAILFVASPSSVDSRAGDLVYSRWFGLCLVGSAVSLFLVAYDPKPYFRVFLVSACLRALAALIGLGYVLDQFAVVVSVGGAQGAAAVALIATMVYAARQERWASASSGTQPKPKEKAKPSGGEKKGKGKKG